MKKIFNFSLITLCFLASTLTFAQSPNPHAESGLKKVIVQEILQVTAYTYLNVLQDGEKKWIAVPTIEAKLGEAFYYKGGMEMPQFESKELNKTFDSVLFLSNITSESSVDPSKGLVEKKEALPVKQGKKATLEQLTMTIPSVEGAITIAELFKNKSQYGGKKVMIKGEVTKFASGIMGKNWSHFQDGTSHEGKYDLMITTQEQVLVGDIVIFEGTVAIDKDFGAGYFYPVIVEAAIIKK